MIVSACLLGVKCRYDGDSALDSSLAEEFSKDNAKFIPVCPEELAGLPTPRAKAEITTGTGKDVLMGFSAVKEIGGADITKKFVAGAEEVLCIALQTGATEAILKEKSPSCGVEFIKRGSKKVKGPGVTTALLIREGIKVEGRY
ncbi:MAG: DUF523 domain-containing protein [Proteobacteria bacterium]|nr:DUF523 domain-containing protein [Pseudomonadota bacterium]